MYKEKEREKSLSKTMLSRQSVQLLAPSDVAQLAYHPKKLSPPFHFNLGWGEMEIKQEYMAALGHPLISQMLVIFFIF